MIPEIPTIQLSVADMKGDPLELMASLQLKYSEFGAVKLVCPKEWNPSQELRYPKMNITSRVQPIHQLRFGKVPTFLLILQGSLLPFPSYNSALRREKVSIHFDLLPRPRHWVREKVSA